MAVTVLSCRKNGWMLQTQRTCYPNVPIDRCVMPSVLIVSWSARNGEETGDGLDFDRTPQSTTRILLSTSALALAKRSDEETSDGLDGQDASRPFPVDGEAVPGGEQAPTQGRSPRRSDPDLSAVREGDLSDRLHQQDDRGTGVPSVQGPR